MAQLNSDNKIEEKKEPHHSDFETMFEEEVDNIFRDSIKGKSKNTLTLSRKKIKNPKNPKN